MSKNSNQSGAFLLIAIVLGAAVYSFMFFGSSLEQKNMSASFGQLAKAPSGNLFSGNEKTIAAELSNSEIRSDLSGVSLPNQKMKSVSGGDYAQTSNPDFPSTGVGELELHNTNATNSTSRTTSKINYSNNLAPSYAIGNVSDQYISNPQNPTKSDINVLLLLDTRAATSAMSAQQGSKRATPALAGKTVSISTDQSKAASKKILGDPGEPSPGASLPIGDGVWILLAFAGVFASNRFFYGLKS